MSTERMSDEAFEAIDPFVIDGTATLLAEARRARSEEARLADELASVVAQRDGLMRGQQVIVEEALKQQRELVRRAGEAERREKELAELLNQVLGWWTPVSDVSWALFRLAREALARDTHKSEKCEGPICRSHSHRVTDSFCRACLARKEVSNGEA